MGKDYCLSLLVSDLVDYLIPTFNHIHFSSIEDHSLDHSEVLAAHGQVIIDVHGDNTMKVNKNAGYLRFLFTLKYIMTVYLRFMLSIISISSSLISKSKTSRFSLMR